MTTKQNMPRTKRVRTPLARHWCFTLNNPNPNEIKYDEAVVEYLVLGKETSTSGTDHVQGYVVFRVRKRLSTVKTWLPRAHWEIMKGTPEQASDYCKKDGEYVIHGTLPLTPKQGAKKSMQARWDNAFLCAKRNDLESIPKQMLIRNYHAFKRIAQDNPVIPATLPEKKNEWIVAPTGYGKSTYAREKYPDYYDKPPNKWWVGYKDQDAVICDDFGPKQCEHLGWYMKRWADNFSFPMETKGGGRMIRPEHIVVTSQYSIAECFFDLQTREAIMNRFKVIQLQKWQVRELLADEILQNDEDITRTTEEYESVEMADSLEIGITELYSQ